MAVTAETLHCPDCFAILEGIAASPDVLFCPTCKLDVALNIALKNAGKPQRKRQWLWASGDLHDEPPPSSEAYVAGAVVILEEGQKAVHVPPPLPEIAEDFTFSDRTRLRVQALDFVLRAAAIGGRFVAGAELQREAEGLEKWIASVGRP